MSNTSQAHGESDSSKIDGAISGEAQGRKPLIAGNWKMNLNHLEAIAVTQKLAFLLN